MKFYYNGQLLRTSKTRHYKYAAITSYGGLLGCSETRENAQKFIDQVLSWIRTDIENLESLIRALEKGATKYEYRSGRDRLMVKIGAGRTLENAHEELQEAKTRIQAARASLRVVELEERD